MIFAGFTAVFSINQEYSLNEWARTAAIIIFITTGLAFASEIKVNKKFSEALYIGFLIAALALAVEIFTHGFLTNTLRTILGSKELNVETIEGSLNRGTSFVSTFFWLALAALQHRKKWVKGLLWIATALLILQLSSLSAIIGFFAATLSFIWLKIFPKKGYFVLAAGVISAMIIFPFTAYKIEPVEVVESYKEIPKSSVHRLHIWNYAAKKAAQKPFVGWGFSATRYIPGASDPVIIDKKGTKSTEWKYLPNHPHNISMQLLLENGVIGFALMILVITLVFYYMRKYSYKQPCAAALLVNYLVIDFFAFNIWQTWWLASAGLIAILFTVYANSSKERARAAN